ncbi:hypothetical protein CSC16_2366 [Proteus mirabilis]|nr:hypothetical protein CSC16_2366 [Proteus mirabilis]
MIVSVIGILFISSFHLFSQKARKIKNQLFAVFRQFFTGDATLTVFVASLYDDFFLFFLIGTDLKSA